jgi:gluconate 5-dehydrogenase
MEQSRFEGLFDLGGRIALVTGSSKGLGYTLARGLGRAGATVVLNGRDQARLAEAASRLEAEGVRPRTAPFDVTRKAEIAAGVERVEKDVGPVDILVNNAGINIRGKMEELTEETWHEVMNTNLTSAFLVSQEVGRRMVARKRGKIVSICSLMSEVGRATTAPYAASKGGLKLLTRTMATEWARHNIQVNGIGPGYFITDLTRVLAENKEFDAWVKARTPAARWGDPEELVGAAVFLASRASDFVSGQIIYVDGGILASL